MKTRFVRACLVMCTAFFLSAGASGCGSACKDLANKICACQPTRAKKENCEQNIRTATRNFELSDKEEDRCQKILDSGLCTCEAISAGAWHFCGLSSDPMSAYE